MLLDGRLEVGVALLLYGDGWSIPGVRDGVVCCPSVLECSDVFVEREPVSVWGFVEGMMIWGGLASYGVC